MTRQPNPQRVALFIPSLHGGGAERVFVRLATYFAGAGHRVDMVLMNATNQAYLDELSDAVRIIDLKVPRLWLGYKAFRRYVRDEAPDSVMSAMPLANGIAAWTKILTGTDAKVVLVECNARSLAFGDVDVPRHRPLVWGIRPSYRFADGIVAKSQGVADRVLTMPGIRPEKVHVIYNPCWTPDMDARALEPVDHAWFHDGGPPVILSAGRLEEQKDFGTLVRAFALLRQTCTVRLMVIGEGSLYNSLQSQVAKLGLAAHVSMPGFVANPFSYMARASVFVLSSRHEGFGNVLVEAMACGTPVVSTDCPSGPSEILEGGRYGPLVPVGDAAALARAIGTMIANPTQPDLLKMRAREFSLDAAAIAYMRVLGLTNGGSRSCNAVT